MDFEGYQDKKYKMPKHFCLKCKTKIKGRYNWCGKCSLNFNKNMAEEIKEEETTIPEVPKEEKDEENTEV